MNKYFTVEEWEVRTSDWDPTRQLINESVFSVGNAAMGIRANFEEMYSGESLAGSYLAGVYYPDKTRVGWWKNGYPEYFAKILNGVKWVGVDIMINGRQLDLYQANIIAFERGLNMRKGLLTKTVTIEWEGIRFKIESQIFCSMKDKHIGGVEYSITNESQVPITVRMNSYLDFDVYNRDANYDEKFWTPVDFKQEEQYTYLISKTKKTEFNVLSCMSSAFSLEGNVLSKNRSVKEEYASDLVECEIQPNSTLNLKKLVGLFTNIWSNGQFFENGIDKFNQSLQIGYDDLLHRHYEEWDQLWKTHDVIVQGDVEMQQGLRFCIFQFLQSFDGHNPNLNIGPKGFTGEKYGGLTYWDTEAFCLPYVMANFDREVAQNLLRYRLNQLPEAIENAQKLGFSNGAALYPMVTIDGHECHNEWEITFEEIHRNAAIAFAIYHQAQHSGDSSYMNGEGLQVLIAIARFWAQRVNWSEDKNKYVILGVTGPNEYENNVNNNWYTNFMACWCLETTSKLILELDPGNEIFQRINNLSRKEAEQWLELSQNMYLPVHPDDNAIFLQQDGFLDKELKAASEIPTSEIPIHHHWSWDRILRSCYIKQADVLQGISYFPDKFSLEEIRSNFDFYLPMTVHESSLSPSVYSTVAGWVGDDEEAVNLLRRAARLDLDDYNADARDGLHVTSMPGAWNALVFGICGIKWINGKLEINRKVWSDSWNLISFGINYGSGRLHFNFTSVSVEIENLSAQPLMIWVEGEPISVPGKKAIEVSTKSYSKV